MSVLKYRKPDGSIGTLGTPASSYVTSVNGKSGAVTGLYDSDNPPPYPVTSVNNETGDITVRRIYSPDGNAHISQANPDATHTRAFYAESTFNGVKSLISCSFDEDDNIHMQVKHGDDSWRDAILYTTKNPPPSSGGTGGITYQGVVSSSISGSGSDSVTANFSGLSDYIGGDGFVVFKYQVSTSDDTSVGFSIDGAGMVHTAMVGSSGPYPLGANGTFTVPLSIIDDTSITIENVSLGGAGASITISSSKFKAYVYN